MAELNKKLLYVVYLTNFSSNLECVITNGRSQCPRGLRSRVCGRLVAEVAGSNPATGMDVCLLCLYVVLSCAGRGLCDGLITLTQESYRVSDCMCVIKKPRNGGQKTILDYKLL
jgi:hypothetical protein